MKKKKGFRWAVGLLLSLLVAFILQVPMEGRAEGIYDASVFGNPNITFTPDGASWTTDYMEKDYADLPFFHTVTTGVTSTLAEPQTGQHLYPVRKEGIMPIEKWVVEYAPGQCIHGGLWYADDYHGLPSPHSCCLDYYKNGWIAYCADCHERYDMLVYMDEDTAKSITSMPLGMYYFYSCPHCENIETAAEVYHECKAISWNRYEVVYKDNALNVTEDMPSSTFMYNNETTFEGETITPETYLRKNRFKRQGYSFAGWNTESDGSGQAFSDEEEVLNLTTENKGTITLYAQWVKSESTLHIHPGSGKLDGASGIVEVTQKAGTTLEIDSSRLTPPKGAVVSFDAKGGAPVAEIQTSRFFKEWSMSYPFHGELLEDTYSFTGPDGSEDTITAIYGHTPITLPEATKPGKEFGGWYKDTECTNLVGPAGAEVIIEVNTTLYANWVTLQLTSVDDYTSHGGSGAVDLTWDNVDNSPMTYQVYQKREGGSFKRIENVLTEGNSVSQSFSATGAPGTYVVPYSGLYTLTATGARGQGFGSMEGGRGGQVKASVFLHAGEVLTYHIGTTGGYNGGGSASPYGGGGGMTSIASNSKGTLLVAGGGGGASPFGNGGPGGAQTSLTASSYGGSGLAGGGGGHLGGNAGQAVYHIHDVTACGYHRHSGNVTSGGACYAATACNGTAFTKHDGALWYWTPHWDNDGSGICSQCGYDFGTNGNEPQGHAHYYPDTYVCNKCGASYSGWPGPTICTAGRGYVLSCSISEGFNCGKTESTVESAKPAYGGSNYVNSSYLTGLANSQGVGEGNGSFSLYLPSVNWVDGLSLSDVAAKDLAAPEKVSSYSLTASGDGMAKISWKKPKDKGTLYYHQVAAHEIIYGNEICRSNVTENTLISGVKGYYYLVDESPATSVSAHDGTYLTEDNVKITVTPNVQYLHVAAVDVAGNVSETSHLKVDIKDALINWPVYTTQIGVSATKDNIYQNGEKTWYVRADGKTPFLTAFDAYINQSAVKDYQPNYNIFQIQSEGALQLYKVYAPSLEITPAETAYTTRELYRDMDGAGLFRDGVYTKVVRGNSGKNLSLTQGFVLDSDSDGKVYEVMPIGGASMKNGKTQYSDPALDSANKVTIIADGQAPAVSGLDKLGHFEEIDRTTEEAVIEITADDAGSGVRDFYAIIQSDEDYSTRTIPSVGGVVTLDFRDTGDYLFNGDFTVKVYAVDNVGNIFCFEGEYHPFTMETQLYRILEPRGRQFKAGESGIIEVDTVGYAKEIRIYYPQEWQKLGSPAYEIYGKEGEVSYACTKTLQFMVPLEAPYQKYIFRIVGTNLGGRTLEAEEELWVEGSVLDELRTRLR